MSEMNEHKLPEQHKVAEKILRDMYDLFYERLKNTREDFSCYEARVEEIDTFLDAIAIERGKMFIPAFLPASDE